MCFFFRFLVNPFFLNPLQEFRIQEVFSHIFVQCSLIFLQAQNIIRTFTFYFFGYSGLCPHCINGDDLTFYLNLIQKFRNRCDFVAFLTNCLLPQRNTIFLVFFIPK